MKNFIPVNEPLFVGNEIKYLTDCIQTGWVSSDGKFVKKFESKFAKKVNRKYSSAVSSGSAALELALSSLDIKKNDEIILPNFTIVSCLLPILRAGAKPILIDCNFKDWNCSAEEIIKRITSKTKVIILVHIYGLTADLDKILKIAKKKNIKIIEDAAEVHGLKYKKKMCGSFGDISTFSFYANKSITTGEGGMLLTDDKKIYKEINRLKNLYFGEGNERFIHNKLGWNYRMSNLQAAVGLAQLENLNLNIRKRRKIGKIYSSGLKELSKFFHLPIKSKPYCNNVYWVYGLVIKKEFKFLASRFMSVLKKKGVGTRPFFFPLNEQPIMKKFKNRTHKFPNSDYISKYGFYIPSGLGMNETQQNTVIKKIKEAVSENF
jgi:perosamine synthetase